MKVFVDNGGYTLYNTGKSEWATVWIPAARFYTLTGSLVGGQSHGHFH
jgi:hypothetical protein